MSFNFVAAATICSDFGVQENKICHYFRFFPFYLPGSDGTRCNDLSFLNVEYIFEVIIEFVTILLLFFFFLMFWFLGLFIKVLISSSSLSAIKVVSSA